MTSGNLILSRKVDEEIIIHKNGKEFARLKPCKINKGVVRLAFQAEDNISIDRLEVFLDKYPE